MKFRKVLALRGPNLWANSPVLEAWVDLEELKDSPSNELPGFNERLMAWLPSMIEHRCSIGERGGFFERLRRGTWQGHILEHVTLELQSLAGTHAGFGRARKTSEEGVYKVAVKYQDEKLARECLDTARRLLHAAVHDEPFDSIAEIERLQKFAQSVCMGPSTRSIVAAAKKRGIPSRRLNDANLVQLGYGANQRRIRAAETDATGAISQDIAQDKDLTRRLLLEAGVPVADGRPVTSAEDAWKAAESLGLPVVVKPRDGNQGRGVATNLTTREQVAAAYETARHAGRRGGVVVETFAHGADYRLLVVGGRMIAAARREPAQVKGDGVHTISELVDRVNTDPRRGDSHALALSRIRLDAIALNVLAEQGLDATSIPEASRVVLIRRNANLSTGGTAVDVTDDVHPEVAARAIEAAAVAGLDIAGIDVVARHIGRPLEEQEGIVVEVNAAPGLRMHLSPSVGKSRPVGEAIIDMMFPQGESGRIPVIAVTGVNGKTTVTRFIAHIVRGGGGCVGMACSDGVYVDERRIKAGDCSGPRSGRALLSNPRVETAVLETARGGILREGLGFDRCDVAVVTNIGEGDHLGLSDIHTPKKLAQVKRAIVDVVLPTGFAVLNAADPLVASMAEYCKGSVLFFARDGGHPVIVEHRAAGGQAVFIRDNAIMLGTGSKEMTILSLDRVPLTHGGRIGFQVENTLAAVAAAWGAGVPVELIRKRAESFASSMALVPGRFNVLRHRGATVIVDYGHNPSALQAVIDAVGNIPHTSRSIVYSTAGDRRDCDLIRQGELLGAHFDRVMLYESIYTRGRSRGEILSFFRQGLASALRATEIREAYDSQTAVETAMDWIRPGELLVIQADVVEKTMDYLERHLNLEALATESELVI